MSNPIRTTSGMINDEAEEAEENYQIFQKIADRALLLQLSSSSVLRDASLSTTVARDAIDLLQLVVSELENADVVASQRSAMIEDVLPELRALKKHVVEFLTMRENNEEESKLAWAQQNVNRSASEVSTKALEVQRKLAARSDAIKNGVLQQAKKITVTLKRLKELALSSPSADAVSAAVDEVSRELKFFLKISDACGLGDETQLLRSAVTDVVNQAKRAALQKSISEVQQQNVVQALTIATNAMRAVVYAAIDNAGSVHDAATAPQPDFGETLLKKASDDVPVTPTSNKLYITEQPSSRSTDCVIM